ncbi:MAG: hypothetical protein AAF321_08365 [Pseudomonadota bacterium]
MADTNALSADLSDDFALLDAFMAETDDDEEDRGDALGRARLLLAAARDAIAELIEPGTPSEPDGPSGDVDVDLTDMARRVAQIEARLAALEARVA